MRWLVALSLRNRIVVVALAVLLVVAAARTLRSTPLDVLDDFPVSATYPLPSAPRANEDAARLVVEQHPPGIDPERRAKRQQKQIRDREPHDGGSSGRFLAAQRPPGLKIARTA